MKVYCGDCKHFCPRISGGSYNYPVDARCDHPNNLEDDAFEKSCIYISKPEKINKDNNCKLYERKLTIKEKFFNLFK